VTEETLPQLLERRRGIPQRTTLLAAAALVLAGVAAVLLLRSGPAKLVHASAPVFNVLQEPGVRRVAARQGELMRLRAGRVTLAVRALELPPYEGDVAGLLPVYATTHSAARPAAEGKARLNRAPGYEVTFPGGSDTFLVPHERASTGVVLVLREPAGAPRRAVRAMRSALRTFEFGTGRN
jgi:hypothetical protein